MAIGDQPFTGHDGGPPPYRPLSGGAVTALVLTLLLAFFALGGPWWLMGLPVLVVLLSWGGVSSGRRRGKALLWISLVLSVGIGAFAWWTHQQVAKQLDRAVTPLVTALDKDDRAALSKWTIASLDRDAAFDVWKRRVEAVRKDAGPWSGHLRLDQGWFGVMVHVLMTPAGATEVEPVGAEPIPPMKAIWICAPHTREDVWFALELGEPGKHEEGLKAFAEWVGGGVTRGVGGPKDGPAEGPRFLRDVRVFRVAR